MFSMLVQGGGGGSGGELFRRAVNSGDMGSLDKKVLVG